MHPLINLCPFSEFAVTEQKGDRVLDKINWAIWFLQGRCLLVLRKLFVQIKLATKKLQYAIFLFTPSGQSTMPSSRTLHLPSSFLSFSQPECSILIGIMNQCDLDELEEEAIQEVSLFERTAEDYPKLPSLAGRGLNWWRMSESVTF